MQLMRKLWIALRRERYKRDLAEEMQLHREMAEADARERGLSPDEGRRLVAQQFGNTGSLRERSWEAVSLPFETAVRDLRYAARQLARNRGFTATAVLTLALGIGAVTAIFSVAYAVLIDPFPYKNVKTLASPKLCRPEYGCYTYVYTPRQFLAIESGTDIFSGITASTISDVALTGVGEPQKLRGNYVTANLANVLGIAPALGRAPTDTDTAPGHGAVVLLSDRYWRARFGGSPSVLGRVLTLNGQPRTVIGIMPKRFLWRGADVYLPIRMTQSDAVEGQHYFGLTGRLKPGATEAKGSAELQSVFRDFQHEDPRTFPKNLRVGLIPFAEEFRSDLADTLYLLLGAVFALLLIACVNVASLQLARAVHREHEFAIRAAVGASRARLLRFALTESLLLALVALPVAVGFAAVGLQAILRLVPPNTIPDEAVVTLNLPVLAASAMLALGTVVVFGWVPAWHAARQQPVAAMRGTRSSKTARQHRVLNGFVVAEIALCLGLLGLAGLMLRSLWAVEHRPVPYLPDHTLAMDLTLDAARYPTTASRIAFFRELANRVAGLPGVRAATVESEFPDYGGYVSRVAIGGTTFSEHQQTLLHTTDPQYQAIASQLMLRGRYLSNADVAGSAHNVVVSENFVKRYYGDLNPLGHTLKLLDVVENDDNGPSSKPNEAPFTIVGVVHDTASSRPNYDGKPWPQVYLPYTLSANANVVLASTILPAAQLIEPTRKLVYALDSQQPIRDIDTYAHMLDKYGYANPRFTLALFGAFAAAALLLTAVGIYGVFSFTTLQRTQEIGIRLTLGAPRGQVLRMVLLRGYKLALAGSAVGVPLALLAGHLAKSQLAFTSEHDAVAMLAAAGLVPLFALAGAWLPALRASRVDPAKALRAE